MQKLIVSIESSGNTVQEESVKLEIIQIDKLTETAIELARMWGIMETLEGIPSMKEIPTKREEENKESLIAWAEEYIATGQRDMMAFLESKLQEFVK